MDKLNLYPTETFLHWLTLEESGGWRLLRALWIYLERTSKFLVVNSKLNSSMLGHTTYQILPNAEDVYSNLKSNNFYSTFNMEKQIDTFVFCFFIFGLIVKDLQNNEHWAP